MNRRFAILACAAVVATTAYARQSSPAPDAVRSRTAAVDAVLSDAVKRGDIPGVVAMVVDRRAIIYQGAFGVFDATTPGSRPLTTNAIFRIASMTKPITSIAAMQLMEQGEFSLDDRADRYLPELANLKVFESFDAKTGAY